MTPPLLEMRDIAYVYPDGREVLRGASLVLRRGERVTLSGANGAGKTTLLHIAVGLLRPTAGVVQAFGAECSGESDFVDARRRIGLVFQYSEDQLFMPTVLEDVAFGVRNLGAGEAEAHAKAREILAALGLDSLENRITYHLSHGEKRLVALAGVLAMEPDAVLLDEPVAGLDEDAVRCLEAALSRTDLAVLAVSHDTAFVRQLGARRLRLHNGLIVDD